MKQYKALQPVTLMAGVVRVTESQARRREYCLKPLGGDEYLIIGVCNFKVGETFWADGLGKSSTVEDITPVEELAGPVIKPTVKRTRKK